jgi:hypothetical protein
MKISFKTYFNDRLKEVDFHGKLTHPLYVQVTFERKTIFFKSYYFELFSKHRYFLVVPGVGSKGPELEQVIERENEVIRFIIDKHRDDFSLKVFKQAYAYYSKDLCDVTEKGFIDYLHTFFWDEGMPALGDIILQGSRNVIAYDAVRDFKRSFNKPLYEKLVANSFYYAPPYLPLYGFMTQTKRWPILILTVMEFEKPETIKSFSDYVVMHYPEMPVDELLGQVAKWTKYL